MGTLTSRERMGYFTLSTSAKAHSGTLVVALSKPILYAYGKTIPRLPIQSGLKN